MKESKQNDEVRVELKYCERCGSLWVRERGAGLVYCESCQRKVAELPATNKKKPGRLILPVGPHTEVQEYAVESGGREARDEKIELKAAGGAA